MVPKVARGLCVVVMSSDTALDSELRVMHAMSTMVTDIMTITAAALVQLASDDQLGLLCSEGVSMVPLTSNTGYIPCAPSLSDQHVPTWQATCG